MAFPFNGVFQVMGLAVKTLHLLIKVCMARGNTAYMALFQGFTYLAIWWSEMRSRLAL